MTTFQTLIHRLGVRRAGSLILFALALASIGLIRAAEQKAPPPFYADKLDLMHWLDDQGRQHPVTTLKDWRKRREHILRNFELATGPLPGAERKVPLDVRVTEVVQLEKYERRKLTFATEHNDRVAAYLLIPKNIHGRVPGVLCLHQTTDIGSREPVGLGGSTNLHYAAELAERGYVTLAPDYPYLGENKYDPYQNGYVSCTMKGIWNHMRAIDLLQSLPEVDGQRIGAIGHSLGGHNSLFVAAYDDRIRCVVSCCGYGSNEEYYKQHKFTGGEGVRYYPRIKELIGSDAKKMPFDLIEIAAALAPRPFLTVAPLRDSNFPVKGLQDAHHALTPLYQLYHSADRLAFDFPDAEHTFPRASRDLAYAWFDRWLKGSEAKSSAIINFSGKNRRTLAASGASPYVIVTATNPTPEEQTASEWLAATLEQVTGAKFPIQKQAAKDLPATIIRIAANPKLKPEEWRIRTVGETLLLEGGLPRGPLYAVCEFLQTHVGVDRLDPFTEVVPRMPTLSIPELDRHGQPAFGYRSVFNAFPYAHPAPMGSNARMWRAWNKEHTYASPPTGDYPRSVPEPGAHTFGQFITVKEFAKSHPEYFSMDADGKRMTDDQGEPTAWYQVCPSNEEVRRITLDRARKFLRDERAAARTQGREPARYLALSQNDNTVNLCRCPPCQAISDREGSESGLLLDYVNQVARGLKEEFPDVLVLTEAYNFTLKPPRSIRPEPNVIIRYCDNYGLSDMTRPLTHPRNAGRLELLEGWMKITKQMAIWDYWRMYEDHPPGFFAPSSNVRALQSDLKLFQQRGVQLIFGEIEDFMGAGLDVNPVSNDLQSFMPLRTWTAMKLLDNPTQDLDKLLERFCRGFYGEGARPMRALLELIENRQATTTASIVPRRRHEWAEAICDARFFAEAYRHLDAAIQAAAKDARSLTHVRRERIVIDSAYLWTEAAVRRKDPKTAAKLPLRAEVVKRFREDWAVFVASAFDKDGVAKIAPFIASGTEVVAKLKTDDTDSLRVAIAVVEKDVHLDGKLNEPFWPKAKPLRLLPRDPLAPNDNAAAIRFAWTPEALLVAIEQPSASAAASWEVSLMEPDRQGVQVALIIQPAGNINSYFYSYPAESGMTAVKGRKSQSTAVSTNDQTRQIAEIRIPWSDLPAVAKAGGEFLVNVATYPKPDSRTPSHVSSPWLIGTSPTYSPAYHGRLKLGK